VSLELLPQNRWQEGLALITPAPKTSLPVLAVIADIQPDGSLTAAAALRRQRLPDSGLQAVLSVGGAWLSRDEPELAQRLSVEAAAAGARRIISERWIPRHAPEAALLIRLRLRPDEVLTRFSAPVAQYAALLGALAQRLRARGAVPASARLVSIAEAPVGAILQMQLDFLGGNAGVLAERLRESGPTPFDPRFSVVALDGDQPVGFVLTCLSSPTSVLVESRIIAPSHRRGWVNVLIMAEAASRGAMAGIETVCFAARDTNEDTRRLARRAPGMEILDRYFRPVRRSAPT